MTPTTPTFLDVVISASLHAVGLVSAAIDPSAVVD